MAVKQSQRDKGNAMVIEPVDPKSDEENNINRSNYLSLDKNDAIKSTTSANQMPEDSSSPSSQVRSSSAISNTDAPEPPERLSRPSSAAVEEEVQDHVYEVPVPASLYSSPNQLRLKTLTPNSSQSLSSLSLDGDHYVEAGNADNGGYQVFRSPEVMPPSSLSRNISGAPEPSAPEPPKRSPSPVPQKTDNDTDSVYEEAVSYNNDDTYATVGAPMSDDNSSQQSSSSQSLQRGGSSSSLAQEQPPALPPPRSNSIISSASQKKDPDKEEPKTIIGKLIKFIMNSISNLWNFLTGDSSKTSVREGGALGDKKRDALLVNDIYQALGPYQSIAISEKKSSGDSQTNRDDRVKKKDGIGIMMRGRSVSDYAPEKKSDAPPQSTSSFYAPSQGRGNPQLKEEHTKTEGEPLGAPDSEVSPVFQAIKAENNEMGVRASENKEDHPVEKVDDQVGKQEPKAGSQVDEQASKENTPKKESPTFDKKIGGKIESKGGRNAFASNEFSNAIQQSRESGQALTPSKVKAAAAASKNKVPANESWAERVGGSRGSSTRGGSSTIAGGPRG